MAVKLLDVTLTAAQLQGLTASHYFWIDRQGNLIDTTQATLVANASVAAPNDQAAIDLSMWQSVEMYIEHAAETNAVGGKVSVAEVVFDLTPPAGAPIVVGAATVDQALAATAESVATAVVSPPTLRRMCRAGVAIIFTTPPTVGAAMRITLLGHRDGQDRARG